MIKNGVVDNENGIIPAMYYISSAYLVKLFQLEIAGLRQSRGINPYMKFDTSTLRNIIIV